MQILDSADINGIEIAPSQLGIPAMNYGQLQRWTGYEQLRYTFNVKVDQLRESIGPFFEKFRQAEISEDDPEDFPELIAFKNAGWPTLDELIISDQLLLSALLIFNEYEVLDLLTAEKSVHQELYSVNSLEQIIFDRSIATFAGVCFRVSRRN